MPVNISQLCLSKSEDALDPIEGCSWSYWNPITLTFLFEADLGFKPAIKEYIVKDIDRWKPKFIDDKMAENPRFSSNSRHLGNKLVCFRFYYDLVFHKVSKQLLFFLLFKIGFAMEKGKPEAIKGCRF